ncbi:Electron transfer flavoprotein small subunit [Candidatus Hodgkinia cicadicola]|uniref:Electron transfer flavoprotein small subunit n=1 Tax=Candidatus Hodgkinia cicadicola TaxID=573658 RepID=A0ABX4MFS6_9HYPH|nr:Electron transfer flavoprotein small subunit [Candidatus Hodgkinia cicadicola]
MKIAIIVIIIYDPTLQPVVNNGILDYKNINRIIDPIDETNIIIARKFKEIIPSTKISVICLGKSCDKLLVRSILSMGVDKVMFTKAIDNDSISTDGLIITKILKRAVIEGQFDLILTGKSSSDNNSGFVGPALATLLGWRQLNCVRNLLYNKTDELKVKCWNENRIMTFVIKLPCVLICDFKRPKELTNSFVLTKPKNKEIVVRILYKLKLISTSNISIVNYAAQRRTRITKHLNTVDSLMTTLFS